MPYAVKEIFYTLQGEGAYAGRPAVFLRFSGCNLWSGMETDRATARCDFCDTDFVGINGTWGGKYAADDLAATVRRVAGDSHVGQRLLVVCTGGEPLLQLDAELVAALHAVDCEVAVETNGTLPLPCPVDWLTVSPKAGNPTVIDAGNELKIVYPQPGLDPADWLASRFTHFYLQPLDGPQLVENTRAAVEYCLAHPTWRLSLQTHKLLGLR